MEPNYFGQFAVETCQSARVSYRPEGNEENHQSSFLSSSVNIEDTRLRSCRLVNYSILSLMLAIQLQLGVCPSAKC